MIIIISNKINKQTDDNIKNNINNNIHNNINNNNGRGCGPDGATSGVRPHEQAATSGAGGRVMIPVAASSRPCANMPSMCTNNQCVCNYPV